MNKELTNLYDEKYLLSSNKNIINCEFPNKKKDKKSSLCFFEDDSFAFNFSFKLPLSEKEDYHKLKDIIYINNFILDYNDMQNNSIFSIFNIHNNDNNLNPNDLSQLYSNNIMLNFGNENPCLKYNYLINKLNNSVDKKILNKEISTLLVNLKKFPIFQCKSNISEIINKKANSNIFHKYNKSQKTCIINNNNLLNKKNYPIKCNISNSLIKKDNALVFNKNKNPILKYPKRKINAKKNKIEINKNKSFIVHNNKFIIPLEESDSD